METRRLPAADVLAPDTGAAARIHQPPEHDAHQIPVLIRMGRVYLLRIRLQVIELRPALVHLVLQLPAPGRERALST